MIRSASFTVSAFLFLLAGCGSSTTASNAPPTSPGPGDDTSPTGTVREALQFVSPCTAGACGEVPASSTSAKPACRTSSGACGWTDPSPNDTVSYRPCAESECGTKPDASVCPSGTTFKGAQCGSENDAACVWSSSCTPPPSTTPCADAEGCGAQPAIGVICQDGSNGGLECMQRGTTCVWQRTCE